MLTMKKAVKRVMMTTQPAKNRNTPNSMEHSIVTKLHCMHRRCDVRLAASKGVHACMVLFCTEPHVTVEWTHHWAIKKVKALHT